MVAKILIIDDDPDLLRVLQMSLQQDGFVVMTALSGYDGLRMAFEAQPDLTILDVGMKDMDGWETLRRLRGFTTMPVLFLTAHAKEAEVVQGLNLGADGYITKPFSMAELRARIAAALRSVQRYAAPETLIYDDGVLRIDLQRRRVHKRGEEILLSPKELQLLVCLMRRAGQAVSHTDILREVWGTGFEAEWSYLTLYIRYLRQKLEDDPSHPRYIQTRYRVGYCFHGTLSSPASGAEGTARGKLTDC